MYVSSNMPNKIGSVGRKVVLFYVIFIYVYLRENCFWGA